MQESAAGYGVFHGSAKGKSGAVEAKKSLQTNVIQRGYDPLDSQASISSKLFIENIGQFADLAGSDAIAQPHLLEAIQYRSLDRNVFY
jgi:predicted ATPase with chaperone activity